MGLWFFCARSYRHDWTFRHSLHGPHARAASFTSNTDHSSCSRASCAWTPSGKPAQWQGPEQSRGQTWDQPRNVHCPWTGPTDSGPTVSTVSVWLRRSNELPVRRWQQSRCLRGQLYVLDGHRGDGEGGGPSTGLLLQLGVSHLYPQLPVVPACGGDTSQPTALHTGSSSTGLSLFRRACWPGHLLWLCHSSPVSAEEPVGLHGLRLLQLHDQNEGLQYGEDVAVNSELPAGTQRNTKLEQCDANTSFVMLFYL